MLKIASFNCNSIRNSERLQTVRSLCAVYDILVLQETMLPREELCFLNNIDSGFCGRGTSPVSLADGPISGRPNGGLCFLWRKSLSSHVSIVSFEDERLLGLQISCNDGKNVLLVNVYLPYDCPDNRELFDEYMGKLNSIVEENPTNYLCFICDFNADPRGPAFAKIQQLCTEHALSVVDVDRLHLNSFTYVSDCHHSTSWLDHAVMTAACKGLVRSIAIDYGAAIRDHIPLCIELNCCPAPVNNDHKSAFCSRALWDRASSDNIEHYAGETDKLLGTVNIPASAILCKNVHCTSHYEDIHTLYTEVSRCLLMAADAAIPHSRERTCTNEHHIPGWNDAVKAKYDYSRSMFLLWISANKPRFGYVWHEYHRSKLQFKYALRQCRRYEHTYTSNTLAEPLLDGNVNKFWSRIRKMRSKPSLPSSVDGNTGADAICDMWRTKYEQLFNSVNDDSTRNEVETALDSVHFEQGVRVSTTETIAALTLLKTGKAAGPDGISAENLKNACPKLAVILSLLFSAMLIHGFLPDDLMKCELIPVAKDLGGDLSSSNNYRPIALASIMSKVFELVLLGRMKNFIHTSDNQFGFKANSGTEMCVAVLKETIEYYTKSSSNVYTCFLDASKAFDRTNHFSLFGKLLKRGVPVYIVRILAYWYRSQNFVAKWGDCVSAAFTVTNGVRQGGILSPYLFSVFMDELSEILNTSIYGCIINFQRLNHIFYADDICLIASSVYALQKLVDLCSNFASKNSIMFNDAKSKCVYFKSTKNLKNVKPGSVVLGCSKIEVVEAERYLGHILTSKLKDSDDMTRQKRLFYARGNSLIRKFKFCSFAVKRTLFKAYCTSFYGCALWCKYTQSDLQAIKVAYNNIVRGFFGISRLDSITESCRSLSLPTFRDIYRNCMNSLASRVSKSSNIYVRACFCTRASSLLKFYRDFIV